MPRDDFPKRTIEVLAKRVGQRCSMPDCRTLTSGPHSDPSKALTIGVAAHISAAAEGGPRYDATLTAEERKSAENGIWLCARHARLIDVDEDRFPVEILKRWKETAESAALVEVQDQPSRHDEPGLHREIQHQLDLAEAGRQMIFDRVEIDRVVARPWLEAQLDGLIASRNGGYVHLEAQAGAGKTSFLARFVRERGVPSFFFDASQGVTKPSDLHLALWAQLVARGHLPIRSAPEGLGSDSRLLYSLLAEAVGKADGSLLLVVDALDEAEASGGVPGLLPVLPEGVTVIASSRPGVPTLPKALALPIDVAASKSSADVQRYIECRASEADLQHVLLAGGWTRERLTREVSVRAAGLFAYAHFVLSDLVGPSFDLSDLEALAPGLDAYYQQTWRRWQQRDRERFRRVLRPALAAVAIARAPALAEQVAEWTNLDPEDAEEALREELKPWVTGACYPGGTRYRLYHQSVRHFVEGEAEALLRQLRAKVAELCVAAVSSDADHVEDPKSAYAYKQVVWHLIEADRKKEAAELLFDLVFLDRHREVAGNPAILGELRALVSVSSPPVSRLLHVWSDESAYISDSGSLLSQISFVVRVNPVVGAALHRSFETLASRTKAPWLRSWMPVPQRSSPSVVLRGHKFSVNHCLLFADGCRLVSASDDSTLRVWNLDELEARPVVLRGHKNGVKHLTLSADGCRLVSASDDSTLRVWNLGELEAPPVVLRGHEGWVNRCLLSADGRRLVSASADSTLRVWDLDEPEAPPVVLRGHEGWVNHCLLSADGRRLVSASDDSTLRVWDLYDLEAPPVVLRRHEGSVGHCTLSADGSRLVSASYDETLCVWDLDEPEIPPVVLRGHEDVVNHCTLSADESRLVSASDDSTLRVWDLDDPEAPPVVLRGHEDGVKHLTLSADGSRLVSASSDATLRVWDLDEPKAPPVVLSGHERRVRCCTLSADGRRLVSASDDSTLRVWDLDDPEASPVDLRRHKDEVKHLTLSADGRRLVSASYDSTLRVWDLDDPEIPPVVLRGHEAGLSRCALSADGSRLVSASYDSTLRVWDLDDPEASPVVLRGHEGGVSHCALSADGSRLVSTSWDATLRVWDLDDPEDPPVVLRGHKGGVNHCRLSADGSRLVSASWDATLRVWDLDDPEAPPEVLRGHEEAVEHCTLSADGSRLVSASADATLRVWDFDDLEAPPLVLRGHECTVNYCTLSANGSRLVSASNDATLRVWDLDEPEAPPVVLRGHEDGVSHCALSADGGRLVSASLDATLRAWDLDVPGEIARFRAVSAVTQVSLAKGDGWVLAGDASGRVWCFKLVE